VSNKMRIVAGSDHAGLALKTHLVERLRGQGQEVEDLGTFGSASVDYPDFALAVARAVADGRADRGLLVCGTGQGVAMTANRVAGVRAAVVADTFSAKATRAHNDANVLCLGQRVVGPGLAEDIVDLFLATPFEGGRHAGRVEKMMALDTRGSREGG
jgi:ribose 5-phosphate isomerase B